MKQNPASRLALPLLLTAVITLAGCGTLDMQLETNIKPSGDFTQSISYTATGAIGKSLAAEGGLEELSASGWQVSTSSSADTVIMSATREFSRDEAMTFLGALENDTTAPQLDFTRNNYLFFTNYHFKVTFPEDAAALGLGYLSGGAEELGGDFDGLSLSLLDSMLSLSWKVTLPGKITGSNADTVDGSSATWNLKMADLSQGGLIEADTRSINWPVIFGISAFSIIIAVMSVLFIRRRR